MTRGMESKKEAKWKKRPCRNNRSNDNNNNKKKSYISHTNNTRHVVMDKRKDARTYAHTRARIQTYLCCTYIMVCSRHWGSYFLSEWALTIIMEHRDRAQICLFPGNLLLLPLLLPHTYHTDAILYVVGASAIAITYYRPSTALHHMYTNV